MKLFFYTSFFALFLFTSCKENSIKTEEETPNEDLNSTLIWSDEFNQNSLNFDEWIPELGANGWGNNELQNYTASSSNIVVEDGILKIIARKIQEGQQRGNYTSARLTSARTFGPGHRIEIRAKVPDLKGNGLWPAIWMLGDGIRYGQSWPQCGEIDIMEYVSYAPNRFYATVHTGAFNHIDGTAKGSGTVLLSTIEEEFNIFGILWDDSKIRFYHGDPSNVIFTFNKFNNANNDEWPFDKPHFFLLNLAVGGSWGGAQGLNDANFPATFEIDYVRVYKLE